MNDNTTTPKRRPQGSALKLAERVEKLKAELEATQAALHEKEARKAELERSRAKKDRTRALIIMGLVYAHQVRGIIKLGEINKEQAQRMLKLLNDASEDYFSLLPQNSEAQKTKTANDKQLFHTAIRGILAGTFK